jgi:uncharacterized protein (DUF2147 family)
MRNAVERMIVCLLALLVSVGPAFAYEPIGTWYTAANRAQVRIARCGRTLCGGIVWLKDPKDPNTGKPWTDINNSDPAKRARPLIGVRTVLDLTPSDVPNKWQGQVYNADDGRTYAGYLTMTGSDSLELKGCVLGGMICKSETWKRARESDAHVVNGA